MDKVSIIVPVYNAQKYLNSCIESCLQQSYPEIEVILVDDGSTDQSYTICEEFTRKDNRVKVIHMENSGVSAARNTGIKAAEGEYILFLDADDRLDKNICSIMKKQMDDGVDMTVCGYYLEQGRKKIPKCAEEDRIYDKKNFKDMLYYLKEQALLFVCWNKMYRKSKIKDLFPEGVTFGEDSIFNMKYLENCSKVKVLSYMGYYYNMNVTNSAMKRYHRKMEEMCYLEYKTIKRLFSQHLMEKSDFAANHYMENIWFILLPALMASKNMSKKEKKKEIKKISMRKEILKEYIPNNKTQKVLTILMRLRMYGLSLFFMNKIF